MNLTARYNAPHRMHELVDELGIVHARIMDSVMAERDAHLLNVEAYRADLEKELRAKATRIPVGFNADDYLGRSATIAVYRDVDRVMPGPEVYSLCIHDSGLAGYTPTIAMGRAEAQMLRDRLSELLGEAT